MTKKSFCLFTTIILSACCLMFGGVRVSANEAEISYEISGGFAKITLVKTNGVSQIVIPDTITENGVSYAVVEIGERSFYGNTDIVSVSLPNTVTKIGHRAFAGCSNLAYINIPEGVSAIEQYTFSDCGRLTSVTLPKNLKNMACGAFKNCVRLKYLTVKSETLNITNESDAESFSTIIADYSS